MTQEYEEKVVKIIDAVALQDWDDDTPTFIQSLELLLKDLESGAVFRTVLEEKEVRSLVGLKQTLSSKQMIDLALLLRSREEPVKMMVPIAKTELSLEDLEQTRKLNPARKKKNKKRRYPDKRK